MQETQVQSLMPEDPTCLRATEPVCNNYWVCAPEAGTKPLKPACLCSAVRGGTAMRLPWWLRWLGVCLQCGRPGFDLWAEKILWRRKWQPTPVLLSGISHGRSLVGYSPWGHKELDMTERLYFTAMRSSCTATREWSPWPQLEKSPYGNEDPAQTKINK